MDLSLQNLIKGKQQASAEAHEKRLGDLARKLYDILATEEQLTFEDSMRIADTLRQVIATVGTTYLNSKYLNHLKQ